MSMVFVPEGTGLGIDQRKLGSNLPSYGWLLPDEEWCETLHLMTFTWWRVVWDFTSDDFYLMKGGVRLYIWWLLPDEGWCETLHLMTLSRKCGVRLYIWWLCRGSVVWDFTSDDFCLIKGGVRLYIWWLLPDEGWCETLHLMTFTWWRVVWDFTSDDFYLMKGGVRLYIWWLCRGSVVWDFTSDDFCLMKGGVRLYIWWLLPDEGWCETLHLMTFTWWSVLMTFTWWSVLWDFTVMPAWMLHGVCVGEEAGARNRVFFRVK